MALKILKVKWTNDRVTNPIKVDLTKKLQHLQFEKTNIHCIIKDIGDTNNPMHYHEPLQTKQVKIGTNGRPKIAKMCICFHKATQK